MTLLPPANSRLQHDLSRLEARLLEALDAQAVLRNRDPRNCDPAYLPWLAWENSISDGEGWQFAETEQAQRNLIADYIAKHRHKGTPSVIRRLFRDLQLGEIDIIEQAAGLRWNGEAVFDGTRIFGGGEGDWAKYAIVVKRTVSNRQAAELRRILAEIAPLRCELLYIDFRSRSILWNGEIRFDGQYNFGAA